MKILEIAYHRNGISGEPFWAARIDDGSSIKFAVLFEPTSGKECRCAVLDPSIQSVAFGVNSWRGDHYAQAMLDAIKAKEADA